MFTLWVALLSVPMLQGKWLASPWSDQYAAGYAFRAWGAEWWHRLGHVPLWNPELFGGLPFVAAGHGDIFYPTSFLRLVLPVETVVNLNFVLHYILAGLFTYWLLRRLHVSWTGAVIGGLAYELSGLIASYPSPGHDGKLFASAALPLAFLALVIALRDKRWEGYPLLALAVALSLLGHFQVAYYLLIATGLFALYLTLEEVPSDPAAWRVERLGLRSARCCSGSASRRSRCCPLSTISRFHRARRVSTGSQGRPPLPSPGATSPSSCSSTSQARAKRTGGPTGSSCTRSTSGCRSSRSPRSVPWRKSGGALWSGSVASGCCSSWSAWARALRSTGYGGRRCRS